MSRNWNWSVEIELARKVAVQLTAKDALGAHARDELGISEITQAQPIRAALASAATFAVGAALPLATAALVPDQWVISTVSGGSIIFLALLGALAGRAGGASMWRAALRVTFWGAFAMAITAAIGALLGTTVA
jgi:VIT1/CCC1 family predicted Fe2+/Mn2+ transporter